ncbi:hypothetical protein PVAP13_9KG256100 [Panicum virgatum]|uniref:Uncharacterized protein n=1 Tax=Panicum virgatum TaxID=38727 RepID=A0A8T0NS50_PANVG|nr:hypothetical protein PVAP13_9KG256100 [Panicum virgatum]
MGLHSVRWAFSFHRLAAAACCFRKSEKAGAKSYSQIPATRPLAETAAYTSPITIDCFGCLLPRAPDGDSTPPPAPRFLRRSCTSAPSRPIAETAAYTAPCCPSSSVRIRLCHHHRFGCLLPHAPAGNSTTQDDAAGAPVAYILGGPNYHPSPALQPARRRQCYGSRRSIPFRRRNCGRSPQAPPRTHIPADPSPDARPRVPHAAW